jgi:hypothetical protein
MTETKGGNKKLMVVVTRAYAAAGSVDDEFVHEWGYEAKDLDGKWNPFEWEEENSAVLLLVIHGHAREQADTSDPVVDALVAAFEKKAIVATADLTQTFLFYHSLKDRLPAVKDKFGLLIAPATFVTQDYSSEGNTAVDGIFRRLDEDKHAPEMRGAVESAATGRRMFAAKLYELSCRLLRLRMLFDAAAAPRLTREAQWLQDLAGRLFAKEGQWKKWLQALRQSRHGDSVQEAEETLMILAKPTEGRWNGYDTNSDWLCDDAVDSAAIRSDFARFARAADVLQRALEDTPTCNAKGSAS